MIASKLSDVALIVSASTALVVALAFSIRVLMRRGGSVSLDLPGLKAKVDSMDSKIDQINTAVNHQPEGSMTLVQRVKAIEIETREHREWEAEVMRVIGQQLGVPIPPLPTRREPDE